MARYQTESPQSFSGPTVTQLKFFSADLETYFELLFLEFYHLSTKIHLDLNLALKDMIQECERFCQNPLK